MAAGLTFAVGVSLAGGAANAHASGFGEEPLSASAAELRRADAAARRADDASVTWLLDEVVYRLESSGATTTRYRRILTLDTPAGVAEWQTVTRMWSPWFEDRPVIEARILDSHDHFHELDARTIEVGPPPAVDSHTVSDRRALRAPLPALAPGAIVEVVLTVRERKPLFAAGSVHRYWFGHESQEMPQTRMVVDAPAGMRLKFEERLPRLVKRRVEQRDGRTRRIYEAIGLPPESVDYVVPGDVSIYPTVGLSTGSGWDEVARSYSAIVTRQIALGPPPAEARVQPGASRRETIRRAVDLVRRELRYTGLELGENEIAPWTPAQVWQRRYGDCKDLSTFLVAVLAASGIEAHVALLKTGPGEDLPVGLPGLGAVDHAIVYVPGEKLWIDPTVELARPGQLPAEVQGRLALVASRATRTPVRIPGTRAADNTITEDRRITLADMGAGRVVEVVRYGGLRELAARHELRQAPPGQVRRDLENYVKSNYAAKGLARHHLSAVGDVSSPFTIELTAEEAAVAFSDEDVASVWIDIGQLFQALPEDLRSSAAGNAELPRPKSGQGRDRGARHPRALEPHVVEWRYVIAAPDGFENVSLPPPVQRTFGPASFAQKFAATGQEVRGHLRFTLSRDRLDPNEVEELKKGVASLLAAPRPMFRFEHRATRMVEAGDLVGGLAEARRLLERAPNDAGRLARLAYLLGQSGLARAAVDTARQAVQAAPSAAWAHGTLGAALRHDPVGRMDVAGFDRRGAIAALEKAAELAPSAPFYQVQLGVLHSLGDDAVYLGGDLKKAAGALEKARELGDSSQDVRLMQVLLRLRETGRLRELADQVEPPDVAGAFRLCGAEDDAGFSRALAQIPTASRQQAILTFSVASLQVGDHDRLRRAFRLAGDAMKASGAREDQAARLRPVAGEPKTIEDLFARFTSEALLASENRWLSHDIAGIGDIGNLSWAVPNRNYFDLTGYALVPARQLFADFARGAFEIHSLGRAGPVEAINVKMSGRSYTQRFYVSHEGTGAKELRLLGVPGAPEFLAAAVLRAADAGRVDEARRVLDWAAGDPAAWKSPNFVGRQMSRFWNRGQRGDRRRIRLAAAGLLVTIDPERSLGILTRECALAKELAEACRLARVAALVHAERVGEAEELSRGLTVEPDPSFLDMKVQHLVRTGAWSELERLAAGKHTADGEWLIQYGLALSWVARGQPTRARAMADALRAGPAWKRAWFVNNVAFLYLFTGASPAELAALVPDLERAQRDSPGAALHHTLATYYAVLGRYREARDALHQLAGERGKVDPADQLILGRLAAQARLTPAARRAYQEVIADQKAARNPHSAAALARRWMAELPAEE